MSLSIENRRGFLARYVGQEKITTAQQLDLAITYLKSVANVEKINVEEFEKKSGIGIVITEEQIRSHTKRLLELNREELLEKRYAINFGKLILIIFIIYL